ncbi:MAG: glycoside hydrolase family 16 protein [Actinomycetales bacterium]|nr:glycoside hydrolase family 16 protein [Actinomycetales bacterium]
MSTRSIAALACAGVLAGVLGSSAVQARPLRTVDAKAPGSKVPAVKAPKLKLLWSDEFNGKAGVPATVQTADRVYNKKYFWSTEITGTPPNHERQGYIDGPVEWAVNSKGKAYVRHRAIETDGKGNLAINARRVQPALKGKYPSTQAEFFSCERTSLPGGTCEWLSGRMSTKDQSGWFRGIGFKYGKIEARIKVPEDDGTWPAFWLLGANIDKKPWPKCGEIDIMEASALQRYGQAFGSLHSFPNDQWNVDITANTPPVDDFYSNYHTYAIMWKQDRIDFLFDGKVYKSVTKAFMTSKDNAVPGKGRREWPFNQEFFLIVNLAMGGVLGGDSSIDFMVPDTNTTGGTMLIDYIRYYSVDGVGTLIRH